MDIKEFYSRALELYKEKNFDAALKILDEIKCRAPDYKKAFMLESLIWKILCRPSKEAAALETLLKKFDVSSPEEKSHVVYVLSRLGDILIDIGQHERAIKIFRLASKFADKKPCGDFEKILSRAIFKANAAENFSAEDFRELYDEYKKYLADVVPYPKKFYNHKKIRVGFLSGNFQWHVVMAWSWHLLRDIDKNFFETYFYSNGKVADDLTERLRATADAWREIFDVTDEAAAKMILDDEIDILFDLNGHTAGGRLRVAAYRPASVQVSGVGYMNSTGLDCFDYFLSDVHCAGDENFFTEKVIKLPHSHICYEPSTKLEPANFPPCVKNNFVTFGSFNQFGKVTDSVLRAWKKISDAVPRARLILKHKIFNTDGGKNFVGGRLKNFGFDVSRVELRPYSANHLSEYADVDIALDTFPYTGGVTTCDALFMGVPVVSLYGQRHGTRFGLSILKNVGLDELAVDSYDEYIKRAVMLAGDWELLKIFRKNLRTMMKKSSLMNSIAYVREMENVFIKILDEQRSASNEF